MILGVNATGSTGNNYYIKADNGQILLLDAGIPINEIKQGINFDIGNVVGCLVTHSHLDHSLSANKLKAMGIPVWQPYESDKVIQRTHLGSYTVECFDVPHSVPCRAFLIEIDGTTILYATDFEFIKYRFSKKQINIMLIEMNYQQEIMDKLELDNHISHTVTGHSSDITTTEFILNNMTHLRKVYLCHYSKSGNLNRDDALNTLKSKLPQYISCDWAIPGTVADISEVPF